MASFTKNPLAVAFGAAMLASVVSPAMADSNPFAAKQLSSGYQLAMGSSDKAAKSEAKCGADKAGEASCGADKAKAEHEGKCGEAKCGADKAKADHEGKCGEAKCGADKAAMEGQCGGDKAAKEASCGAAK
ncbi:MAG: hypothetical protein KKF24_01340 [Gammaproteobacteria bacterium]|jgi:uncharacterized low-complexity protein|nr:hypothetical protein [Zhongshania sp.]MBU0539859.1 hypothetical protein [Gammaproteobacteria bacterium]MBU1831316.1 hypothetical protein [Gammaproteobacteria bacterium]